MMKDRTKSQNNRLFHQTLETFKSIVIQPSGQALDQSCSLDLPVFTLRSMPVKEQYKKALEKVNAALHPEQAREKIGKADQSIQNMMLSSKGNSLDMQRQLIELGLNIKACKNIKVSDSTLFEKLTIDKKLMETEEEVAIFKLLLLIKQN